MGFGQRLANQWRAQPDARLVSRRGLWRMDCASHWGKCGGDHFDQRQSRNKKYGHEFPESRHDPYREQQLPGNFLEWRMEWKLPHLQRRVGLSVDGACCIQWQQCYFGGWRELGELERFQSR